MGAVSSFIEFNKRICGKLEEQARLKEDYISDLIVLSPDSVRIYHNTED